MPKLTTEWERINGAITLTIRKSRGKLTLNEIEEFLRYENRGNLQGRYLVYLNASEESCGGSGWGDEIEPKGDAVQLIQLEPGGDCPVCGKLTPPFDYCPKCGQSWKEY